MTKIKVKTYVGTNVTIIDLAFTHTGSLAGVLPILRQLPKTERVGFRDIPSMSEDVPADRIDQTWTPELEGLELTFDAPRFNTKAIEKGEYSTPVHSLYNAISWGVFFMETFEFVKDEQIR